MTQEQKQFIIKALQSGVPAIAKSHIEAVEEVARVEQTKREDLNGQEDWKTLNQSRHDTIVETLQNSFPFMAYEYINAYYEAVRAGTKKFSENMKARQEKEKAEKEAEDQSAAVEKKKKSA